MSVHAAIVSQLAQESVSRTVRRTVRRLQRDTTSRTSGTDSGLRNVWDEICVQAQFEESVFWPAYLTLVRNLVAREVEAICHPELCAIWFETNPGSEWESEAGDTSSDIPVFGDDVIDHVSSRVISLAADWSNPRIRAYLAKGDHD
jgi:hypothetical protein